MIYLKLIYNFLIVGLFSFGGGYSSIPLVYDVAKNFGNITDEELQNFIAISESTPGPVAVNIATFIGTKEAGLPGAIIATIAEIFPAFVIIIIFAIFLTHIMENKHVKFVLSVIRPSVMGIMMAVGLYMFYGLFKVNDLIKTQKFDINFLKSTIILIIIIVTTILYKKFTNKKFSTIKIIILGAMLGIAINILL